MRKRKLVPNIDNILRLFTSQMKIYSGASHRSYQKAFSSFQIYVIANYSLSSPFNNSIVENWVSENIVQGLSQKTIAFYLEKISSLYSGVAHNFESGKLPLFKEVKSKFKSIDFSIKYAAQIKKNAEKIKELWSRGRYSPQDNLFVREVLSVPQNNSDNQNVKNSCYWASLALLAGVKPDIVISIIKNAPQELSFLKICEKKDVSDEEINIAVKDVETSLYGEKIQWFAMRLRPRVKFEHIIERFSLIGPELKMPEFFYPNEEIAKRVGRKMVWQGKPVIRDVVFFKKRKSEIYQLFTKLYDLAWCYRNPGGGSGNYAPIPDKAMENFKKSLGFISPDFEIAPAGEMELKPGDVVIIVTGDYIDNKATILKEPSIDEDGNKIYRVSLLNCNGRWDIGIDARLIKKV